MGFLAVRRNRGLSLGRRSFGNGVVMLTIPVATRAELLVPISVWCTSRTVVITSLDEEFSGAFTARP
jgi:hypothetical protein